MAHPTRHTDQTIDAPETDADSPQPRSLDDALADFDVARFEREHRARTPRHRVVERVLRVRFQARVADAEAVGFEELGDALRVGLLLLETDFERLDAAQQEPGVEGGEAAAGGVDGEVEFVAELGVVDGEDAGHEVVVAGEVFGAAFVDDVGAEVERVLEEGGQHGVVYGDEGGGVGGVGERGDGGDVDDLDEGVCGRFEEDHGGFGGEDGGDGGGGGSVDVVDDDFAIGG